MKSKYKATIFHRICSFFLAIVMVLSCISTDFFGFADSSVAYAASGNGSYVDGQTYYDYGSCSVISHSAPGYWTLGSFSSSVGGDNTVPNTTDGLAAGNCYWHYAGASVPDHGANVLSGNCYYYAIGTGGKSGNKYTISWSIFAWDAGATYAPDSYSDAESKFSSAAPSWSVKNVIFSGAWGTSSFNIHMNGKVYTGTTPVAVNNTDVAAAVKSALEGNGYSGISNVSVKVSGGSSGFEGSGTCSYSSGSQRSHATISGERPANVNLIFEKRKSSSQVPAGLEDSRLYTPSQSAASGNTKTSLKVAYDDNGKKGEQTITLDAGTWSTANNSGTKMLSLDADLLEKDWYITEVVTPGSNYSSGNNPSGITYKIGNGKPVDLKSKLVKSGTWKNWYKLGKIGSKNAGTTITISATNTCQLLDPLVSVHKTLPNGNIAEVVGVKYRVQYYDTLDSGNDNKYFYLSALSADSAKKAAAGKNASNTASKYYSDTYINDSNIYPNNVSKVKTALNKRVTDAKTRAENGSLALSDYNSDNYRDWVFKTVSDTVPGKDGNPVKVGALKFNREAITSCYAGSYSGNDKLYKQNGQDIAPAGTYVITEFAGNDSYYSNAMSVIILKISNKPKGKATYTAWLYEADGSNADTSGSHKQDTFNAAVIAPDADGSISQENFSTSMPDLPKAGSLTVEKSLDDNGIHMDGHADSHDGDNDANVTDMTVTMALYYKDKESNPKTGY